MKKYTKNIEPTASYSWNLLSWPRSIILTFIIFNFLDSNSQSFQYSNHLHLPAISFGSSCVEIVKDNVGNLYMLGKFSGTVDFDFGPGVTSLSTSEPNAVFIAKYSTDASLIWVKEIETPNGSFNLNGLDVDQNGNVVFFGKMQGTIDMDPGNNVNNLSDINTQYGFTPDQSAFLAKYNSLGEYLWAFVIHSPLENCGVGCVENAIYDIAFDSNNNVIAVGDFQNNQYYDTDFDPGPNTVVLPSSGFLDIFMAKYSPSGEYIMAKSLVGPGSGDHPNCVQITENNTITITGGFSDTVDFDPDTGTFNLSSNGPNNDIFIARYNISNFSLVWAKGGGGSIGIDKGDFNTLFS